MTVEQKEVNSEQGSDEAEHPMQRVEGEEDMAGAESDFGGSILSRPEECSVRTGQLAMLRLQQSTQEMIEHGT